MTTLLSICEHIRQIFSTAYGWILSLFVLLWNFINPEIYSFGVVGLAVLIDLFWGIVVSLKKGEFVLSEAGRETFKKVSIYGCSLFVIFIIERTLHDEYFIGTKIACALAAGCELWSISANMLIVKPNMPFLRIFRMQLKGEMEKKVGTNLDDILEDGKS